MNKRGARIEGGIEGNTGWLGVGEGERRYDTTRPSIGRAKGKVELRRDAGSKGRSEEGVRLVGQSGRHRIERGVCVLSVVWLIDNLTY